MTNKILPTILFVLFLSASVIGQDRGLTRQTAVPEARVALVIGNGAYEFSPLKNPVNDARAMAKTLGILGFTVILKENINQVEMKRAVREFGDKIKDGGVGLFYFAGHGVQVKGQNYLIPVGSVITKEEEIEYEGLDAGFVMAQMESAKNRMNIVILDACRNNPFARSVRSESNGLASINAPSGTLIAYATAPGAVANDGNEQNGLYTQELLMNMRTTGLSIEEVFKRVRISVIAKTQNKQTPWESSSLTGAFYFVIPDAKQVPATQTAVPAIDPVTIDLAFWDSIKNSKDPEDYKAYLEKFPNGQFVSIASRRIHPPATEPPAGPAFTLPTMGQTGRDLSIKGAFDGNRDNTKCMIGDVVCFVVEESPGSAMIRVPLSPLGQTRIAVSDGKESASSDFRNIAINLSVPKTELKKGEKTTLTIKIFGLSGIKEPVSIQLITTGAVTMSGGISQTIRITPGEVPPDGAVTVNKDITGTQKGSFLVVATMVPPS